MRRCGRARRRARSRTDHAVGASYVLMNYQGKPRDVMMAHELGHGVHQVLAPKTER